MNVSVICGDSLLMPVSSCQFLLLRERVELHMCVLLSVVACFLNDLLTHCCYLNLCSSKKKVSQGQERSQCDAFLLQFRKMMPFQE